MKKRFINYFFLMLPVWTSLILILKLIFIFFGGDIIWWHDDIPLIEEMTISKETITFNIISLISNLLCIKLLWNYLPSMTKTPKE